MLIYLHGFRSSPSSFKARLLAERLRDLGREKDFACPQLPVSPRAAIDLVESRFSPGPGDTLIGSSLGACYATWLAERHGCRAVLLNPATRPATGLAKYLGPQTQFHDPSQSFELLPSHLDELASLQVQAITRPERYLLIAATGDELLDWREMVAFYPGARQIVIAGSDHGLSDFADYLDAVLGFADAAGRRLAVPYGSSRPEAEAHQGPLWGRAEATSASSGLRTAPPPSLSTWV